MTLPKLTRPTPDPTSTLTPTPTSNIPTPDILSDTVQWPTWLVWLTIVGAWLAAVVGFGSLPLWVSTPVLVVLGAWYMSLQHELVHGRPTRSATLNRLLGIAPLAVWYPFDTYKTNHLRHHHDPDLTLPGIDTESNYISAAAAARMGVLGRWLKTSQRTVLGRLLITPALVIYDLLHVTVRNTAQGDFGMLRAWAVHLPLLALLLWGLAHWCGIAAAYYCFVVGYLSLGLAMLRSLYEHRPAQAPQHRTVINEAGVFWRLLFLNNNYHAVHHAFPGAAWYRIPAIYRAHRTAFQERNGGFVLPGYGWLIRHFAFRPIDSVVFESALEQVQAGAAPADLVRNA